MKSIPTIATGILAVFLILSPVLASAATTYTLNVSTDKSTYTGATTGTITFGVSPGPGAGTQVQLVITNPSSTEVWADATAVSAAGAATDVFGTAGWTTSGTYTVTASWAASVGSTVQTATTTFQYNSGVQSNTPGAQLLAVQANGPSIVWSGQQVQIFALAYWTSNGTAAARATWTASVWTPSGTASSISWSVSSPAKGIAEWTATLPAGSANGLYAVDVSASEGGYTAWTQTGFTVNSAVASSAQVSAVGANVTALGKVVSSIASSVQTIASAWPQMAGTVAALGQNVSALSSSLSAINSNFNTLSQSVQSATNAVSGLQSTLTNIQTSIGTITSGMNTLQSDVQGTMSTVQGLSGLQSTVSNLSSTVSNEQTYILVVAAIAAVTLVLELAILIRKMS